MKMRLPAALLPMLLIISCSQKSGTDCQSQFSNLLDVAHVPRAASDWDKGHFSDEGAWFGFGLPDSADPLGGFTGPIDYSSGRWLGPSLLNLCITDAAGRRLDAGQARWRMEYLPGRLVQRGVWPDLELQLSLVFLSSHSALVTATLSGEAGQIWRLSWAGEAFDAIFPEALSGDTVLLLQSGQPGRLTFPPGVAGSYTQLSDGRAYELALAPEAVLDAGGHYETSAAFSLPETGHAWAREAVSVENALKQPQTALADNSIRWNGYLDKVLTPHDSLKNRSDCDRVAVKALMTLVSNWKAARGDLFHAGFFPSAAVGYFNGFWGWDTWKIAVAWAQFAPEVAKDGIRAMFDYQNEAGMLADCIYADKSENNWRDTKPPLAAWAVWSVYESDGDIEFLKEMWPALTRFHQWWYAERDHDGNGLCEYGSTDGTVIAAKWESGMDDGLRYDASAMVKNSDSAWSLNQESVDLNSYLCMDKAYLARIADVLGLSDEKHRLTDEAARLKQLIQTHFWDEIDGFFYDRKLGGGDFIRVKGPEGWIPLTWGQATDEQAARVKIHMLDEKQFATFIPFPTIPADHEKFMTGYWRGPVWLDQAGFGVKALRQYGYEEEAWLLTRQLFQRPRGLLTGQAPIHENYNPLTGEEMKAPHFSWSASHYLLMYWGW